MKIRNPFLKINVFLKSTWSQYKYTFFAGVTKNNNKIPSEEDTYTKESLLQELHEMAEEKSRLALHLSEQNGQINSLRNEISKLMVSCFPYVNFVAFKWWKLLLVIQEMNGIVGTQSCSAATQVCQRTVDNVALQ